MERKIEIGNTYKHFKGHIYKIVAIAYDMFNSLVDKEKYPEITQEYRFQEIE